MIRIAPLGREILLYLRWIIASTLTLLNVGTVGLLTARLREGSMAATTLLTGAAIIWVLNILTFTIGITTWMAAGRISGTSRPTIATT